MPKVEQLDWSKLTPKSTPPHNPNGTQQFKTYTYVEPHKNSKHGAVKTTKRPKFKDYQLGKAFSHIKSIMRED